MEIRKLNVALEKNVKILLDENLSWTKYAISCEIKDASRSHKLEAAMAQVRRLQGLLPPDGALAAPAKEQNFASFLDTNLYKNNIYTKKRSSSSSA